MALEKPAKIWWNGAVTDWENGVVHITAETASRGVNVFEGVMAYKLAGRSEHAVVDLDAHLDRLARSAALLDLPMPFTIEAMLEGVVELVRAEPSEKDLYVRPTVFLESGSYTADPASMRMGACITAYTRERSGLRTTRLVTSRYVRPDLPFFPAPAKSGAVYAAFRLARIAAVRAGGDEPLLLNQAGNVAETAGAALVAVVDGQVVSPPPEEGALDSITLKALAALLAEDGRELVLRSLHPEELLGADEVFLCGTLDEVVSVTALDGTSYGEPALTRELFDRYRGRCTETADPAPNFQTRIAW